ncbi:MAG: cupredoxin domain-containing protein [Candidatus Paceibacterota bacterium]|jgi:plastocyanin
MKKIIIIVVIVLLVIVGFLLINGKKENQISQNVITIENFAFSPAKITVSLNTVVVFDQQDSADHQIAFVEKDIKSLVMKKGNKFEVSFDQSGIYNYYCTLHPSMKGKIIVQ